MGNYDETRTVGGVTRLRVRYDEEGCVYIPCDCGARRYVREAPMTECSKCGAHYTFWVKQNAPPIGRS